MLTYFSMLLQEVNGSAVPLIMVLICWALYIGLFLVIKPNRGLKKLKVAAIGGLIATVIADIVWFFKFFDNFEYKNPGISGAIWFVLLPVLMFLAVLILSYFNSSQYIYDEKKRKEAEKKAHKKEKHKNSAN